MMDKNSGKLTVFFEEPFWVGIFERVSDGKLSVCKVTFGAEPKDCEILAFVLKRYTSLTFSPAVTVSLRESPHNPKRMQREAKKQLQGSGIGTKSQQALQLWREEMKRERQVVRKEEKEEKQKRLFALKQQKRKQKHRGK